MAANIKIDSNASGLRYAEEVTLGALGGSEVWTPLEPNSYDDFGGSIITKARNPINDSRQRKKGVTVDLDANGGFTTDLTATNMKDMLQGFFFADLRKKGEEEPTAVTGTTDLYDCAATAGFVVNSLIKGTGFGDAANNVSKAIVTAIVTDTTVEVLGESLVTDGSPASGAKIDVVGQLFTTADLDIVVSGNYPTIFSNGGTDFTTLGLIVGEWIFVGGDSAASDFVNAANNGFKRIRSITATAIEIDKSDSTMVVETGTSLDIELYFGTVLKNEEAASIVRRSYNLERTLGLPDAALSAQVQAEYLEGQVPGELTFNMPTADIVTLDLSFMGTNSSTIDGPTSLKAGTRPSLVESDAFNTSSDFSRINLSAVVDGDEAPTPLFAYAQDITITINNNLTPNKAVGTLGSFEVTAGTFEVGGSLEVYFADVAAIESVRANTDITIDMAMVKSNTGIILDLPLLSLGDGRPEIEQDEAIMLPIDMTAATGISIDSGLNHTALMMFYDYLPTVAG